MNTGKAVVLVAIWFSVVGALFATAGGPNQFEIGSIGFICAVIATILL